MPNPQLARKLAYLAGLLGTASLALMTAQILGEVPIGLAMYAALGAVVATMCWLAMWVVNHVHEMHVEQAAMLARRYDEAPTGEVKTPSPGVRSTPVAVVVPVPRVSDVDTFQTFQRRPSLTGIPAALLGQIFRLGVEGEKHRHDSP